MSKRAVNMGIAIVLAALAQPQPEEVVAVPDSPR